MRGAVATCEDGAVKKGLAITCEVPEPLPLVRADSERVGQITRNLLSNAIKFTPSGGRIDVRLESTGTAVALTVRDTGVGIPPRFLPFVFDQFRQADARMTRRFGGLGIGLTIVQALVALHGGVVSASSDGPNLGTAVRVEFPIPVAHSAQAVQ